VLAAVSFLLLTSCGDLVGPGGGSAFRTFAMGFTDFPHANSTFALLDAWQVIANEGDLAVLHFDGGVPWQEALDGAPYPASFQSSLDFKRAQVPLDHVVYLAVTPINGSRDGLAGYPSELGQVPAPPPWDGYTFDDPEVIEAYIAHCQYMIDLFDPDVFAYGIEVNMIRWLAPEEWEALVDLCAAVYASLIATYPTLPVFLTFQADTYFQFPTDQDLAIRELAPYTDIMAVSGYPFSAPLSDPNDLRSDYFSAIADIAPQKPFGIAETAWPAEDVGWPYWQNIPASPDSQALYVRRILDDCDFLDALFVCWFFTRDFDDFWETDLQFSPDAPLIRMWRDTGLYDGEGNERPGLEVWREELARPLSWPLVVPQYARSRQRPLVHVPARHPRRLLPLLGLLGEDRLGGQKETRHARRVLERRADDLRRVDDA
jgi:hypothetical protein